MDLYELENKGREKIRIQKGKMKNGGSWKGHNRVICCFLLVCFIAQPSAGRIDSLPFCMWLKGAIPLPAQVRPVACDFRCQLWYFMVTYSEWLGSLDRWATAACALVLVFRTPLLSNLARWKGTYSLSPPWGRSAAFFWFSSSPAEAPWAGHAILLQPSSLGLSGYNIPSPFTFSGFSGNMKEHCPIQYVLHTELEDCCYFLVQYPTIISIWISNFFLLKTHFSLAL